MSLLIVWLMQPNRLQKRLISPATSGLRSAGGWICAMAGNGLEKGEVQGGHAGPLSLPGNHSHLLLPTLLEEAAPNETPQEIGAFGAQSISLNCICSCGVKNQDFVVSLEIFASHECGLPWELRAGQLSFWRLRCSISKHYTFVRPPPESRTLG